MRGKISNFKFQISLLKLESITFYFFLFLLPTQLGLHFWPQFSYVSGIRIDYLSPTLFISDLCILLLFFVWLLRQELKKRIIKKNVYLFPTLFLATLITGIIFSERPPLGWYGLLKLLEFFFVGWYVSSTIIKPVVFSMALGIGIIFEVFLSLLQFYNQQSMQGIFYFLGERAFTSETPGIANASLSGHLVLRPYGTFSHPNVLAGYFLIASMLIIICFLLEKKRIRAYYIFGLLLASGIGILLAMSRTIWALTVFSVCVIFLKRVTTFFSQKIFVLGTLGVVLILVSIYPFVFSRFSELSLHNETVMQRIALMNASFEMIRQSPLFGVGLKNSLVQLPHYYQRPESVFFIQPVHNVFLLFLSEIGIVGFGFVMWFFYKTSQNLLVVKKKFQPFFLLLAISLLTIGMTDHYLLTIQQGQLLLSIVIGLMWNPVFYRRSS